VNRVFIYAQFILLTAVDGHFCCRAVVNILRLRGHQLQELYLDGEELTDASIAAVAACPILRCFKVSFSGQLTDVCLLWLKVLKLDDLFLLPVLSYR